MREFRAWRALLAAAIGLACAAAAPNGHDLVIADFDSGTKPGNRGDFGAWIADPADPQQGALEQFDRAGRYGSAGNALRLIYSVQSDKPAFGGLWFKLRRLDAGGYAALALRVRGDAAMGFTRTFKIELKDAKGGHSSAWVRGVSDQWQDIAVPLGDFAGTADPAQLDELVVVIEDRTATARRGMLLFDDLRLVHAAPAAR